jgi:TolA-binding protein
MVPWRRFFLVVLLLLCSARPGFASSSSEDRAYRLAADAFRIESWEYAEKKFGEFVLKYPKSPRIAAAILFQAEARYRLGHFPEAIQLLNANRNRAGSLEDQYLFWMAQAHYQNTNYETAAHLFAALISEFPDSSKRLEAGVEEATAFARLGDWQKVITLLQEPGGVFQQAVKATPTNEFVVQGALLLGEAQLAQKNFAGAEATLNLLTGQTLDRESGWRREYLRCRLLVVRGLFEEALANTTNLLMLAGASGSPEAQTNSLPAPAGNGSGGLLPPASLGPESWAFRAGVLEELHRLDEAIGAYTNNLGTNAPVDLQRRTLLKVAELNQAQDRGPAAIETLENFLALYPRAAAADMALLAIGELQLKQAVAGSGTNQVEDFLPIRSAATNLVQQALARFDTILTAFPDSPLAGKALLDKGWCLWLLGNYPESERAFQLAAERLPVSEDRAVAFFKWGDARFMLNNFTGAISNYNVVVTDFNSVPGVKERLTERALYQIVRAALAANNPVTAGRALQQILQQYPDSFAGDRSLLLVGQGLLQQGNPARARELFLDFENRYPNSPLLPEVRLAVAHTFEAERNWDSAIHQYSDWIDQFTNHTGIAHAEFSRAWDYFKAGQESNAFALFTNFVVRFPGSDLARQAQWCIGDYYFNQGEFQKAENNYQLVWKQFTNWPSSALTFQAQMMAGRAAMARLSYGNAFTYFTNLASNPTCPNDLRYQACFASADAAMNLDSEETNRPANLKRAIQILKEIPGTNELAPFAAGRIGDCYLQLAATDPERYTDAATAYQQTINSPRAPIVVRSQAKVGLGRVAEGLATLKHGDEQTALLKQALQDYLDVFFQQDLRDGEQPDLFWVKEAGYKAARLAESFQDWAQAIRIYQKMQELLPQLRATLDSKILRAQNNAASAGK